MKRNAKRLTMLATMLASVAALVLVPASAFAATAPAEIVFAGAGSGWVKGAEGAEGGIPNVNCHWDGTEIDVGTPAPGECKSTAQELGGIVGITVNREVDLGSEFGGWEVLSGTPFNCAPQASFCTVLSFGGQEIKIKATFVLPPPEELLKVSKNGSGSGTVTSEPAGINCGVDCEEEFVSEPPTVVTLTGTPATGSKPVVWDTCPGTVNVDNECEVTMDAEKEAVATFDAIPTFALNLSTSGTGSGSFECDTGSGPETCPAEYEEGTEVEVIANADAGSEFVEFTGDCSGVSCELTMDEAHSVGAVFDEIPTFALKLSTSGTGSGALSCNTGSGSEPCQAEYEEGEVVTVIPKAGANSKFVGWTGACSGSGECKVTMDEAKSVGAVFDLIARSLTINKAGTGSGSVTCNGGSCAASYPHGTKVTLAATPASGSTFAGWSGGGCSGTGPCVVTLTADTTVTATFNADGTPPPPPPPPPPGENCLTNPALCQPGLLIANGLAKVKGNKALLKVRCQGEEGARCRGMVKLFAKVVDNGKTKKILVGKTPYNLPTKGAPHVLSVELTKEGINLVLEAGRRGLKVKLKGDGVRNRVVKLKQQGGKG